MVLLVNQVSLCKDFVARSIDKVSINTEHADPVGAVCFYFFTATDLHNEEDPKTGNGEKDG